MRLITCPVCKKSPESDLQAFSICLCKGCGNRWTFIPEDLDSDALYEDEVYTVVDNRKSIFEWVIFREGREVLDRADSISFSKTKRLLDFGSGKGQFLAIAKKSGWTGLGIETAKERADFAREKYEVEVRQEYYSGGKVGEGYYDLITLNHVLEHLPDPLGLLKELLDSNLISDGKAYIEVPRADSWQSKIAGQNWIHWDIPKHLTHWTETGLEKELYRIGYKKVGHRSFSIHLGVLGMLQALMSQLGFKGNLILSLKRKKTPGLLLGIGILLPFAWILETISVFFGKSGIMGIYLKSNG
ncbi:MAG: class I SAM-dependent methyltransferase [Algoriphagus sp.]|nr:class I SAM-dependent methyltransferase [Algoriphagus sp.]